VNILVKSNHQKLPIKTGMIVFGLGLNGSNDLSSPNELEATYTAMRHEKKLIDFNKTSPSLNGPSSLGTIFQSSWEYGDLDMKYMGLPE